MMRDFRFPIAVSLLVALMSCAYSPPARASGLDRVVMSEPPSRFFPGNYFEYKAQFYLKNKDYKAALEMFQLSGYWANKRSQYNAGVMLFNGIGVPIDKVSGVAWLRIAAEGPQDLAQQTLKIAEAALTAEQKAQADEQWRTLHAKYGNKVALDRALDRFAQARSEATGSHLGSVGKLNVIGADGLPELGTSYYADKDEKVARLIARITGTVSVGAVTTLNVPDDARVEASKTPQP